MTEPLIVDPDRLVSASSALGAAAAEIPIVTPYAPAVGADPLSMAISDGARAIELPMQALPDIRRDATAMAANVGTAGKMYADADRDAAEKASRHQFANYGAPGLGDGGLPTARAAGGVAGGAGAGVGSGVEAGAGSGLGSGAGVAGAAASSAGVPGAGQAGAPMQMVQQAGQIPQQIAQMAGSAPQSVMQGAQGAFQQVQQLAGQFGKSSGEEAKPGDVPVDRAVEREDRPEDRPFTAET